MTQRSQEEVGEIVKLRRLELRLAPNEVADQADIDSKTYARLEDGTRWPQERTRLKIETVLQWEPGTIAAILDGEEAKPISGLRVVTHTTGTGSVHVTPHPPAVEAVDLAPMVALSFLADEVDGATSLSSPDPEDGPDEIENYISEVDTLVSAADELTDAVHKVVLDAFDGDVAKLRQMKREVRRINMAKRDPRQPSFLDEIPVPVELADAARAEDDPKEDDPE